MAEALQANIGSKSAILLQRGLVDPKFHAKGVTSYQPGKTRLNDLLYSIKSAEIFLPFCHNLRIWPMDGERDRIPIAIPHLHSMQRGKNVSLLVLHRALHGRAAPSPKSRAGPGRAGPGRARPTWNGPAFINVRTVLELAELIRCVRLFVCYLYRFICFAMW